MEALRRGLDEPILVWDTTTVPNGTYFVRVVASDAPSNPAGTALTGELDSTAFEIDNTPPAITVGSVRARRRPHDSSSFDVKDDHSPISRVEYSQDGGCGGGGVSGRRHRRLEDRALRAGDRRRRSATRGLTLRATDSMNNVATTQVDAPPATPPLAMPAQR